MEGKLERERAIIEGWLHYIGRELAVGSPNVGEPPLVEVRREGHDTLLVQTSQGWARIALISCGDATYANSMPIYPARVNVLPVGGK